jgi:hypothetical protein
VNTRVDGVTARPILGIIAIIAMGLLAFAAIRPGGVLAASVEPIQHDGNPTCAVLLDIPTAHEFKIEPVTAGLHQDPDSDFEVTITLHDTDEGQLVDFSANLGVEAVFAKGGNEGNLYVYDPAVMSDTGLHAPVNPSGKWAGLSHLSFCFADEPEEVPTPTPTPTEEVQETATPTPTPTEEVQETATPTPTPEETVAAGTGTPEQTVAAATGTPEQAVLADTAAGSVSSSLAAGIFAAILLLSLVAMGKLNAVAARRRR